MDNTDVTTTISADIKQLANGFGLTTYKFLEQTQHKVELAKAAQDSAELVKEQIKLEVIKGMRMIFARHYAHITGEEAWDE